MRYTNEDFERLYIQYIAKAMPLDISIQTFCLRNKIPFNLYNKWYRDTRYKVVQVEVEPKPSSDQNPEVACPASAPLPCPQEASSFFQPFEDSINESNTE